MGGFSACLTTVENKLPREDFRAEDSKEFWRLQSKIVGQGDYSREAVGELFEFAMRILMEKWDHQYDLEDLKGKK